MSVPTYLYHISLVRVKSMMKKYEIFICLGSFLIYERSKKDDDDEPKFLYYRKTDTGFIFFCSYGIYIFQDGDTQM